MDRKRVMLVQLANRLLTGELAVASFGSVDWPYR